MMYDPFRPLENGTMKFVEGICYAFIVSAVISIIVYFGMQALVQLVGG